MQRREQLARQPHLGNGGRLTERVVRIPTRIFAPDQTEPFEGLIRARHGRWIDVACVGDLADRYLAAPVASLLALVPVEPEHPLGSGCQVLRPQPALERPGAHRKEFLPHQPVPRVGRGFFRAHVSRAQFVGGHRLPFALHELAINRGSEGI